MIVRVAVACSILVGIGFVGGAVLTAFALRTSAAELADRVARLDATASRCREDVVAARAKLEVYDRWLDRAKALKPDATLPVMGVGGQ